jgi:hypothetical protein
MEEMSAESMNKQEFRAFSIAGCNKQGTTEGESTFYTTMHGTEGELYIRVCLL